MSGRGAKYTAVRDANVHPALLRDVLLSLADADLYSVKWSAHIRDEWKRSLLWDRPGAHRGGRRQRPGAHSHRHGGE